MGMSVMRKRISTNTPWEALAGYSRAIQVGNAIYVSGTTASDADGAVQHIGDAGAQTTYIVRKIERALVELGASLEDVVRTRIFVRRLEDWPDVARAHGKFFTEIRPANTLVRAEPIDAEMLVEIEVDALIDKPIEE